MASMRRSAALAGGGEMTAPVYLLLDSTGRDARAACGHAMVACALPLTIVTLLVLHVRVAAHRVRPAR
jgi:hypothetical protein